ncbi:MAG TPA: hypothetical protein VE999_16885 [Gemmataceae bacterium]|nr:hypothetical protein [Gemmataceae bacterium]
MIRAHVLALAALLLYASLASAQSYYYPDPASSEFRDTDPSGPFAHSPYFHQYQYRRPTQAYPLDAPSSDPGYYPDPATETFPDPSGPYFHSSHFYNYEYRRTLTAFSLSEQG